MTTDDEFTNKLIRPVTDHYHIIGYAIVFGKAFPDQGRTRLRVSVQGNVFHLFEQFFLKQGGERKGTLIRIHSSAIGRDVGPIAFLLAHFLLNQSS